MLAFSDENYFKDLKSSKEVDKTLWLVHLVQLKKLFLKLSAYVELYLKQDWSLLPVPDFKLVARSEEITSHLNFMVAAVLLTATHCGKNLEYEKILELVVPTSLRKDIKKIQDVFMEVLEPKSPNLNSPRTPRKTSCISHAEIVPKVLFPSNLSLSTIETKNNEVLTENINDSSFNLKLQEIIESPVVEKEFKLLEQSEITFIQLECDYDNSNSNGDNNNNGDNNDNINYDNNHNNDNINVNTNEYNNDNINYDNNYHINDNSEVNIGDTNNIKDDDNNMCNYFNNYTHENSANFINLQNEIKLLEIKLSEMEKLLVRSKEFELSHTETLKHLSETRQRLNEKEDELMKLKEKQEYEKIERNSFMASFDQEREILEEQIEQLRKQNHENSKKIEILTNNNASLASSMKEKEEFVTKIVKELEIERELVKESMKINMDMKLKESPETEIEIMEEKVILSNANANDSELIEELNQSKLDNSKLVKALRKARDHIITQDLLIKDLKEAFTSIEMKNSEMISLKDQEINEIKELHEQERTSMNRILMEIGNSIQKTNL